jgi:enoyl-CoA hydratase/carnithine racemase
MATNDIVTARSDHVLTITLNRPAKRNALSAVMLERLRAVIDDAGTDGTVRVILVRGAGSTFCAGLDLQEMSQQRAAGAVDHSLIEAVLARLEACPHPTIAMVHGEAIAGGCELALHCDLRVAAEGARFAMPLARLGLAVPYPLALKLVETIGAAATKELLFTGEAIEAEQARALGMVNRVVPAAALESTAAALASTIAANAPLAVQAMKQYTLRARRALTAIPHDDLDALSDRVRTSADVREGLQARLEKRRPVFRGA